MTTYLYKGVPIVAPLTIESNEPLFVADMLNLKQERVSQAAQRWELTFNVQFRDDDGDYFAEVLKGISAPKEMVMPQLVAVDKRITSTSTPTVAALTAVNSNTVSVNISETGTLIPAGTFVKFSNHKKIYAVLNSITTTGGTVSMDIYPRLIEPVPSTTLVYHANTSVKPLLSYYVSLDSLQGVTYEDGLLVNPGSISLIEALE